MMMPMSNGMLAASRRAVPMMNGLNTASRRAKFVNSQIFLDRR